MGCNMEYDKNGNRAEGVHHYPGSSMATAAMFLSLAAIFSIFTIYLPLVFGSIAIILAILSKGYGKKLLPTAKVGISIGIGSISLILVIFASAVSLLLTSSGDSLIKLGQQLDSQYEKQTGTQLEDIFGQSYEDIMKEYVTILDK